MKEIICAHQWGSKNWDTTKEAEAWWKMCGWCKQVWHEGAPEPRVVMMRLEEVKHAV